MISTQKLLIIARKWKISSYPREKRISPPRTRKLSGLWKCEMLKVNEKGHFVFYSTDGRRFAVPLPCLQTYIFQELFKLAEEEFRLSSNGPIRMPFDPAAMEYAISLLRRGLSEDSQRAVLDVISLGCCSSSSSASSSSSSSLYQRRVGHQQLLVC
ncbi:hypothetical protein ACJRO7_027892 [Eucalyptus globulus]|uniref:Uncharacterized protein n=1 Tax=Eucalyptus globulus TaxID=34317 RepID=A0ABD3JYL2_EUCGL